MAELTENEAKERMATEAEDAHIVRPLSTTGAVHHQVLKDRRRTNTVQAAGHCGGSDRTWRQERDGKEYHA